MVGRSDPQGWPQLVVFRNPPSRPHPVEGNTGNATLTSGRLSKAARERQRGRLRKLRDELIAEGAKPGRYLPELERRAATWPE